MIVKLSLVCSAVSFALMIYVLVSTWRRALIRSLWMRARATAGVAQVDQADAAYRDRHLTTMRAIKVCIGFVVAAVLLLGLAAVTT